MEEGNPEQQQSKATNFAFEN